jgi:DHA3 family tetracycline resistance protein-like MFS transporter
MFSIINNQYLESYGRATLLSFFGQMDAFGQIVGGLIIGFFANQYGVEWGLILTALLHCMIVYALIRFNQIRQTKSQ